MPTYVETWDETKPAGSRARSLGDDDIREFKRAFRERFATDHIAVADESGYSTIGYHKKIVFAEIQTLDPTNEANMGYLYIKDVSAKAELFWEDEDGNVLQLTSAGDFAFDVADVTEKTTKIDGSDMILIQDSEASNVNKKAAANLLVPTGSIVLWGGAAAPTGWLLCNGSAQSRTTYADLFAVIGTTFGSGDGALTFNLPDLADNIPMGAGSTYALASTGGAATVTLAESEIPAHEHSLQMNWKEIDNPNGGVVSVITHNVAGATADFGAEFKAKSTGGGGAHNNLPPYLAMYYIIKY